MSLLRFLGLGAPASGWDSEPDSLKTLAVELEGAPAEEARLVAAFAYLLARVAHSDLDASPSEVSAMAERLVEFVGLEPARAQRLTRAALACADLHGASDDHLVARAFRDASDGPERERLIRCLYAVAAADETISGIEDNEIFEIASAIGVDRRDVVALRAEFKQYLGSLRALPQER